MGATFLFTGLVLVAIWLIGWRARALYLGLNRFLLSHGFGVRETTYERLY
jgi:hypothetical protein